MEQVSIYILAGGKSSRMGSDKGLLMLNGKPMIQYIIDTVTNLNGSVAIISNNEAYASFGLPVYPDLIENKGPVGGIYTALSNSTTDLNLILSCDTPFISLKLIQSLIQNSKNVDVCIPSFKGRVHPLIGVYKTRTITSFKNSLAANSLKLMEVNQKLNMLTVKVESEFDQIELTNLNTKSDLEAILNNK